MAVDTRLLVWGLVALGLGFLVINLKPYMGRDDVGEVVRLEVVGVTTENGRSVDLSMRTAQAGRELAGKLAQILGVYREPGDEDFGRTYVAEVLLFNQGDDDLELLDAGYVLRIDGHDAAFGTYERAEPLLLRAHASVRVFLSITLNTTPVRFANLVEKNIQGEVVGEVSLKVWGYRARVPYRQTVSLSRFDI